MALLFQVVKQDVFLGAVEPFLMEDPQEVGRQLKEEKTEYNGIKIESFTTPQREVSLYRAGFDDMVVYANSPVGLRRILDAREARSSGWPTPSTSSTCARSSATTTRTRTVSRSCPTPSSAPWSARPARSRRGAGWRR